MSRWKTWDSRPSVSRAGARTTGSRNSSTGDLRKRGVNSTAVFVSYNDKRIDESAFNKMNYTYTLWIYEQDKALQKLDGYDHLVPLAMKLTDNRTSDNVWIATSVFNDIVKKKFYKEKYAGTLMLIFRANGIVK